MSTPITCEGCGDTSDATTGYTTLPCVALCSKCGPSVKNQIMFVLVNGMTAQLKKDKGK